MLCLLHFTFLGGGLPVLSCSLHFVHLCVHNFYIWNLMGPSLLFVAEGSAVAVATQGLPPTTINQNANTLSWVLNLTTWRHVLETTRAYCKLVFPTFGVEPNSRRLFPFPSQQRSSSIWDANCLLETRLVLMNTEQLTTVTPNISWMFNYSNMWAKLHRSCEPTKCWWCSGMLEVKISTENICFLVSYRYIGGRAEWSHLVDNSNISMRDRVEIQWPCLVHFHTKLIF